MLGQQKDNSDQEDIIHDLHGNSEDEEIDGIVADPNSLESLTATLEKLDEIIVENQRDVFMLNESLKRLKQEKEVVTRYLEKSKDQKSTRREDLRKKKEALESKQNDENSEFQKAFTAEKEAIIQTMDRQIQEEEKAKTEIASDLQRKGELMKEMKEYDKQMAQLRKQKEDYDSKLRKIKYDFMLKMAIENEKLQVEHIANEKEEKDKDKEEAETQVKQLGVEIHENNTQMNEKSVLQRYEISKLNKQKAQILKLNKNYKRDMMLNAETMEEYSKRQQTQNKKIKLLKSKIQILEKSLSQIVQDFEKEKSMLKKQNEEVISGQREELDILREDSRQKTKELKMLKSLSNVVIQQRSDIEQFFLEALEQIKEEIKKKIAEEKSKFRVPGSLGYTMGSMGKTMGSQDENKSYADKVDLNDLDWEDRERVLRLLFSKINAGVHPSQHWKDVEGEGEEESQALVELEE
ncbi:unnamed protein product [Moneuplotes crassus]|uniref:Uncharacterized protein n=2 Tax=Euplotes crassus TaxID=5936 RepID=A0AAD1UHV7_EUPCR|nr:unnamed protein product [Moneuplotes crassus]